MISLLRIILATLLLASCAQSVDFEFEAESENLSAKAAITKISFARRFEDGFAKFSGNVTIKNTSLQPQGYSNMWLWLRSGEKVQARAWLDNWTSHYIDEGEVEIEPGDAIELSVYWVLPESEVEKFGGNTFVLEIRASGE